MVLKGENPDYICASTVHIGYPWDYSYIGRTKYLPVVQSFFTVQYPAQLLEYSVYYNHYSILATYMSILPARPEGAVNDACWVWLTRSTICQAAYKKEDALMLPDTAGSETLSASMCNKNMLAVSALIDPYYRPQSKFSL